MNLVGKVVEVYDKSVNFNINKTLNIDKYDKLMKVLERIEDDGFKTNINVHKEYSDNIYISAYKTAELSNLVKGRHYKITITQPLSPNAKGYINFNVHMDKASVLHYVNYLEEEDD